MFFFLFTLPSLWASCNKHLLLPSFTQPYILSLNDLLTNDSCELAHRLFLQLAKKIGFLVSNSETHSKLGEGKKAPIHCLPPKSSNCK